MIFMVFSPINPKDGLRYFTGIHKTTDVLELQDGLSFCVNIILRVLLLLQLSLKIPLKRSIQAVVFKMIYCKIT